MPLVTANQFQLRPDPLGAISRGVQLGQQFRAAGREEEAFDRQAQIRQLLGQAGQQAPQTEQEQMLAAQTTGFGGEQALAEQPQALLSQDELIAQARRIDPVLANQALKEMGFDDPTRRAEASRFATQLQSAPFERRANMINARAQSLQAQGRDPKDTIELLDLNEAQQNQALQGVQLLDLSTKERFAVGAAQAKASAKSTAAGFQDIERRGNKLFGVNKATGQVQEIPATPGASAALQEQHIAEEESKQAKRVAEQQKTTFTQTQSLRKEFESKTKPQQQALDAFRSFESLQKADESLLNEFKGNFGAFASEGVDKEALLNDAQAISDVALIFSFFKTVDPTSTVREGEFATIENAGGVQTRFSNMYNRLLKGGRLNEAQRAQIIRIAENKATAARKEIGTQERKFSFSAEKQGINPELVIIPEKVGRFKVEVE